MFVLVYVLSVASWELFNRDPKPDFSETKILHLPVHDNGARVLRYFARLKGMVISVLEMCPRKLTI
jgi:hypothetical protein